MRFALESALDTDLSLEVTFAGYVPEASFAGYSPEMWSQDSSSSFGTDWARAAEEQHSVHSPPEEMTGVFYTG